MTDLDTLLRKLFIDVFDIEDDEYSDDLSYDDTPDWDSLGHMKMVAAISQELDVEFDIEEVMAMETVGKIKEIVGRKL
jgi:acyl carrier protein